MSACERCWSEAQTNEDPSARYLQLVRSRTGERTCSPEEQAGSDAEECPDCKRMTRHQHTGECMLCHALPRVRPCVVGHLDQARTEGCE